MPATGLGAPYYMEARALIWCNLQHFRSHLIRAGLESIAYQVKDVVTWYQQEVDPPSQLSR